MGGTRVLVVEDESLLAEALGDLLRHAGCEPVGPAATVAAALGLIEQAGIDVALLDIRLGQEMSFPVAYALRNRGIPWAFLTSYPQRQLPDDLSDALVVEKPFNPTALVEIVQRLAMGSPVDDLWLRAQNPAGPVGDSDPRVRGPILSGKHVVTDIVLVDDDDHYREVLSADLADRGFVVSCFADGPSLLEAVSNGVEARVALLDWSLPEMSGFELLGALRHRGFALPVVFLTGYALAERELRALDRGAVDFVDKARGTEVLAHRLRLIIEGQRQLVTTTQPAAVSEVEQHGELALHRQTARTLWRQQDVGLTITEYKIVALLVSTKGQVQTYRAIYDTAHYEGFVAGSGEHGHNTNVRSLLKRIRRKFLKVDPGFAEIENEQGVGYRWRESTPLT